MRGSSDLGKGTSPTRATQNSEMPRANPTSEIPIACVFTKTNFEFYYLSFLSNPLQSHSNFTGCFLEFEYVSKIEKGTATTICDMSRQSPTSLRHFDKVCLFDIICHKNRDKTCRQFTTIYDIFSCPLTPVPFWMLPGTLLQFSYPPGAFWEGGPFRFFQGG